MVSIMSKVGFDLQVYFEDNVQIASDERKRTLKVVSKIVERIAGNISEADERFSKSLIHVGSHYQGLKTGKTDEFDINVTLVGIKNVKWDLRDTCITYGFREIEDDKIANETNRQDLRIVEKGRRMKPDSGCGQLHMIDADAERFEGMTFNGDLVPYLVKQKCMQLLSETCKTMRKYAICVALNYASI